MNGDGECDRVSLVLHLGDYEKLCDLLRNSKVLDALELVKKSLNPPSRAPQPRAEVRLDGFFTYDDKLSYVLSPLYISLQNKSVDVFQYLLSLCPTIVNKLLPTVLANESGFTYCSNSETLLHTACRTELVEVIKDLLARGAKTEVKGCKVGTALHIAAEHGRLEAMKLLLDSGAEIEACDSSGNTALLTAVAWDMLAGVQLLLERGADISATSCFGDDVLSIAIRSCSQKVLTYLCEYRTSQMFTSSNGPAVFGTPLPAPPPLLLLAAYSNKNRSFHALFKRLITHSDCPPHLVADASLISASCTVYSSTSLEKFKDALRLKQSLQSGPLASILPSSWYSEHHEVSSIQEWEEMQPGELDYYLQSCIILERCLGTNHPVVYEQMYWLGTHRPFMSYTTVSELCLRCLDMFVTQEELKLKFCNNALFEVEQFSATLFRVVPTIKSIKLSLKGFEVFVKLQERHTTCSYFKTNPTPKYSPAVKLMKAILTHFHAWIATDNLHHKAALGTKEDHVALTQFRNVLDKLVQLCHSCLNGRGIFNVTWTDIFFKDERKRHPLVFLLVSLLQSDAVSRVNMLDPWSGIRPLHYFSHGLYNRVGKIGVTLLLSYGAHLDVASKDYPTFSPGKIHHGRPLEFYPTVTVDTPGNPFIHWLLQEAALVSNIPINTQLSSPLPLLCLCSWAILEEKIPYHRLNLPTQIKDYIALHDTEVC